jgi:hypothetical protein
VGRDGGVDGEEKAEFIAKHLSSISARATAALLPTLHYTSTESTRQSSELDEQTRKPHGLPVPRDRNRYLVEARHATQNMVQQHLRQALW